MLSKKHRRGQRFQEIQQYNKAERLVGCGAAAEIIPKLKQAFPKAFPEKNEDVRPLDQSVNTAIIEYLGCSKQFADGVLYVWKRRVVYCKAILRNNCRYNINGEISADTISDRAKQLAQEHIDRAKKAQALAIQRLEKAAMYEALFGDDLVSSQIQAKAG